MDVVIKSLKRKKRSVGDPRVRRWNLTTKNATKLLKKIKAEGSWRQVDDMDTMWEAMAESIQKPTKEVLGISRGGGDKIKSACPLDGEM